MAQMNIDLDRLGKISQDDLTDSKTLKKIVQYLYQLSEQLKYWQYNLEEENLTPDLQRKLAKASGTSVSTASTEVTDEGIDVTDQTGRTSLVIGENGDITARSVTTQALTVGGSDLGTLMEALLGSRIIVSETQPDAAGVVWIQPAQGSGTASRAEYTVEGNGEACNGAAPNAVTFTFDRVGTEPAVGSTCTYGIKFRVQWLTGKGYVDLVKVEVTGTDENGNSQTVTILNVDPDEYVATYGYFTVDTLEEPSAALTNVTFGNSVSVKVTLRFSAGGTREFAAETFRLVATGDNGGTAEVRACTVNYIS